MNRRYSAFLAALWLVLAASAGRSQDYPTTIDGTATQTLPGYLTTSAANDKLRLDVRRPGLIQVWNPGNATTAPSLVGYSNYRGGRAVISTVGGDPYSSTDDNRPITGPTYTAWAGVTVQETVQTGTAVPVEEYYEVETAMQPVNNPNQDIFVQYPTQAGDEVRFSWQVRQDHPTLTTVNANNVTGANGGLAGFQSAPLVLVTQSYRLVDDKVRVDLLVQNVSTQTLNVGGHIYVSPMTTNTTTAGDRYYINGIKEAVDHEIAFPSANQNDDLVYRTIPTSYRVFDNEAQPTMVLGGVWDGGDIRTAAYTAGAPTSAMLVDQNMVAGNWFTYQPLSGMSIGSRLGVMVRWRLAQLAPNQATRYITYFGLGGADGNYDPPYALTLQGPFSLGLATGDDPATPATEESGYVYRTPSPMTIRATVYNTSDRALAGLTVSLALPPGLALASGTDTLSKSVPSVLPRSSQLVSWQVRTLPSLRSGQQTYSVSASGAGMPSKVIDRSIGIPALPSLEFPNLSRRLDMLSIPYDFANRDMQHVLGSLGTIGVTGGGNAAVARWNPASRAYAFFPEIFLTSVVPGEGFWLFNGSLAPLTLPADRVQLSINQPVAVGLNPGWNMIGCPYTTPVRLFDCTVVGPDGTSRKFLDAVGAGWVRPVVYEYLPNDLNPGAQGSYGFSGDDNTYLNPWRGYWIRATQAVTMVYQARSTIGPMTRAGGGPLALAEGWEMAVSAESAATGRRSVLLGCDTSSADGYDSRDVAMPPPLRADGDLRFTVVRSDWGRDAGGYLRDIQSGAQSRTVWRVAAECDRPNEDVTLRWNLRGVPADVQLTLVDLETGSQRHMRTSSTFAFNTGAAPRSRVFEVVAARGTTQSVSIPFLQAGATRGAGVTVDFALTAPATVDVIIESPTGRRVKVVAAGLAAQLGQNSLAWDGRDEAGRPVPAGMYRCRVLVSTPDGQRAIAERMVRIGR